MVYSKKKRHAYKRVMKGGAKICSNCGAKSIDSATECRACHKRFDVREEYSLDRIFNRQPPSDSGASGGGRGPPSIGASGGVYYRPPLNGGFGMMPPPPSGGDVRDPRLVRIIKSLFTFLDIDHNQLIDNHELLAFVDMFPWQEWGLEYNRELAIFNIGNTPYLNENDFYDYIMDYNQEFIEDSGFHGLIPFIMEIDIILNLFLFLDDDNNGLLNQNEILSFFDRLPWPQWEIQYNRDLIINDIRNTPQLNRVNFIQYIREVNQTLIFHTGFYGLMPFLQEMVEPDVDIIIPPPPPPPATNNYTSVIPGKTSITWKQLRDLTTFIPTADPEAGIDVHRFYGQLLGVNDRTLIPLIRANTRSMISDKESGSPNLVLRRWWNLRRGFGLSEEIPYRGTMLTIKDLEPLNESYCISDNRQADRPDLVQIRSHLEAWRLVLSFTDEMPDEFKARIIEVLVPKLIRSEYNAANDIRKPCHQGSWEYVVISWNSVVQQLFPNERDPVFTSILTDHEMKAFVLDIVGEDHNNLDYYVGRNKQNALILDSLKPLIRERINALMAQRNIQRTQAIIERWEQAIIAGFAAARLDTSTFLGGKKTVHKKRRNPRKTVNKKSKIIKKK